MTDDSRLLIIGNRNYSSWSLRAWLALRCAGLPFATERIPLDTPEFAARIARYSRARRVPVLVVGDTVIWDSLAIALYGVNETGRGLPANSAARGVALSACAEMHSGFAALRAAWPMNLRAKNRRVPPDAKVRADLERIEELFIDCRTRFGAGGPWLFGEYTIADACYAPVVCRYATYGNREWGSVAEAYVATTLSDPALLEWSAAAAAETEVIEHEEVGRL